MIPVTRLNHAVLYVRDADVAADFYQSAFGFEVVERIPGFATFLRAHGGENHHELGLFTVGPDAQPIPDGPRVGLYHLAWEVPTIEALADARTHLQQLGALVGQSDHGASKSLYARTPTATSSRWCGSSPARLGASTPTAGSCRRSTSTPSWPGSG